MAVEVLTVTGRAMPLDLLLFLRYRREIRGFVEATYAANPGLAAKGTLLPVGTEVRVTPPPPAPAKTTRRTVKLYD